MFNGLALLLSCEDFSADTAAFSSSSVFLSQHRDPRLMFDMGPQFSSCLVILGMSFERYIMVCFASQAKTVLTKTRRIVCYMVIILLMASCWALLIVDFSKQFLLAENLSEQSVKYPFVGIHTGKFYQ